MRARNMSLTYVFGSADPFLHSISVDGGNPHPLSDGNCADSDESPNFSLRHHSTHYYATKSKKYTPPLPLSPISSTQDLPLSSDNDEGEANPFISSKQRSKIEYESSPLPPRPVKSIRFLKEIFNNHTWDGRPTIIDPEKENYEKRSNHAECTITNLSLKYNRNKCNNINELNIIKETVEDDIALSIGRDIMAPITLGRHTLSPSIIEIDRLAQKIVSETLPRAIIGLENPTSVGTTSVPIGIDTDNILTLGDWIDMNNLDSK